MNRIKLIVYTLLVCVSFSSAVEAKSRGGSFKSGFSSQKRAAAKPAPTYKVPAKEQTQTTAFGSFGTANAKNQQAPATAPQSQMSKDLSGTASQSNALKAADARNKVNDTTTTSESGWFRSGKQNASPQNAVAGQPVPSGSQTFERRNDFQRNDGGRSNGMLQGLMWFMVGNSIAHHASAANVPQVSQAQVNGHDVNHENSQGSQQNINGENNSINADGFVVQRVQDVPAGETESFFMKIVRVLLWVVLISGIIWVVRKVLGFRHRNVKKVNYSLGS